MWLRINMRLRADHSHLDKPFLPEGLTHRPHLLSSLNMFDLPATATVDIIWS